MGSINRDIERLNEAIRAFQEGQGWGLGMLKEMAKRHTVPAIKNKAREVLEEKGAWR